MFHPWTSTDLERPFSPLHVPYFRVKFRKGGFGLPLQIRLKGDSGAFFIVSDDPRSDLVQLTRKEGPQVRRTGTRRYVHVVVFHLDGRGKERAIGNDDTGPYCQEREVSHVTVRSTERACFEITEKPNLISGDLWAWMGVDGRRWLRK